MNSRNHIMFGTVSAWFYKALIGVTPGSAGFEEVHIWPRAVASQNLTHAEAVVGTPRGDVVTSWRLATSATCAVADENEVLTLSCAPSDVIQSVAFASFGTPTGTCSTAFSAGTCASNATQGVVASTCVGKPSCQVCVPH